MRKTSVKKNKELNEIIFPPYDTASSPICDVCGKMGLMSFFIVESNHIRICKACIESKGFIQSEGEF
jgi:hypothetical protein